MIFELFVLPALIILAAVVGWHTMRGRDEAATPAIEPEEEVR